MIMIKIEVVSYGSDGARKVLYRNTVAFNDDLVFDYSNVIKVLTLLYPKSDGVEFCVM